MTIDDVEKAVVTKMDRVVVTNMWCGIVHMQVCAVEDATDNEILVVCNRKNPSGTTNGWSVIWMW